MYKAYKCRVYPTKEQKKHIDMCISHARYTYNYFLNLKIEAYQKDKTSLSYYDMDKLLTELRNSEDKKWLQESPRACLSYALKNLDTAYKNFFRTKKGFPKFKSRFDPHQSYQVFAVKINPSFDRVNIPKCKNLKLRGLVPFEGDIKLTTITRTATGKYFISFTVKDNKVLPPKVEIHLDTAVGIDIGVKDFVTLSDGTKIANPKFLDKDLKKLGRAQRALSRKQKGSKNRAKARLKVAKIHENIKNRRDNFQHVVSKQILLRYDTICIEDLNVKGMIANHNLARAISQTAFSNFARIVEYKAEWMGKNFTKVGRFYPSSKNCHVCGEKNFKLKLSDRVWTCATCLTEHDRDDNAAKNIKLEGVKTLLQLS